GAQGLSLLPLEAARLQLLRAQVLRRCLTLMATILTAGEAEQCQEEMAEVLLRAELWSKPLHRLLLEGLLWPGRSGALPHAGEDDEIELYYPAAASRVLKRRAILDAAAQKAS
ncbi:unnamed protein product, partial [Chrysoparadoxa australica]